MAKGRGLGRQLPNRPGAVAQKSGFTVGLYNKSDQMIPIQLNPGGDFYLHEQQVHLQPGKAINVPKDQLRWEQIENLCGRGLIQVISDTEKQQ